MLVATGLCAMAALVKGDLPSKTLDCFFGFSIGNMLATFFFSLYNLLWSWVASPREA